MCTVHPRFLINPFFRLSLRLRLFIPLYDVPSPHYESATAWQKLHLLLDEVRVERGESVMVFVLNVLNVVGMAFLILYTGYGLSVLPLGMILGRSALDVRRMGVEQEIAELEAQVEEIRQRHEGGDVPHFERARLDRLERQGRPLEMMPKDTPHRS